MWQTHTLFLKNHNGGKGETRHKKILKQIFSNLDEEKVVSKWEMLLTVTTCTLAGILLGILVSPKKRMMIGSHNGCYNGNYPVDDMEDDAYMDDFWDEDDEDCLSFR